MNKHLGAILDAQFGYVPDMPFLCGLRLRLGINDASETEQVYADYVYNTEIDPNNSIRAIEKLHEILKLTNCHYVSELIGKPVEIVFKGRFNEKFSDFRFI